jgi:hypothetical protein
MWKREGGGGGFIVMRKCRGKRKDVNYIHLRVGIRYVREGVL